MRTEYALIVIEQFFCALLGARVREKSGKEKAPRTHTTNHNEILLIAHSNYQLVAFISARSAYPSMFFSMLPSRSLSFFEFGLSCRRICAWHIKYRRAAARCAQTHAQQKQKAHSMNCVSHSISMYACACERVYVCGPIHLVQWLFSDSGLW